MQELHEQNSKAVLTYIKKTLIKWKDVSVPGWEGVLLPRMSVSPPPIKSINLK